MRTIKFRQPIYSLKGEFKTFHYWGYMEEGQFISPAGFLNVKQKNSENNKQQDQFTGLTDRNGKEIYDNDVIYLPHHNINVHVFKQNIGATAYGYSLDYERGEVIGNIHENKELIF